LDPAAQGGSTLPTTHTASPLIINAAKIIDCLNPHISSGKLKEDRNILQTKQRRKANWIGHILRRNCLLKHVIEGKIKWTRRRRRRFEQLPDDLEEKRRY